MSEKEDWEKRSVVDYRALIDQTIELPYPMPDIDEQLEGLAGCKCFKTLDWDRGNLQMPLT